MNRRLPTFWIVLASLAAMVAGCVEREMTITSNPSGAIVTVSGRELGRTPLKQSFTWYGDYDIQLRLDGYETLKTHADLNMPPYEIPPFDLLSELAPWTYRDERYLHYSLVPHREPTTQELLDRGDALRIRATQPVAVP